MLVSISPENGIADSMEFAEVSDAVSYAQAEADRLKCAVWINGWSNGKPFEGCFQPIRASDMSQPQ